MERVRVNVGYSLTCELHPRCKTLLDEYLVDHKMI